MRSPAAFVIAVFLASALPAAPAPAQSAWDRAVADYARGLSLKAERMSWRIEELDASGSVESWEEVEILLDWSGAEVRSTVVVARKDGKDVTEAWRERLEKGSSGGGPPSWGDGFRATPFEPGFQEGRIVSPSYRSREDGAPRLFTPYELRADGKTKAKGSLVSDEAGEPLYARQTWDPLPFGVASMDALIRYARGPGGELVVASLEYRADAAILFVRKRFRFVLRFSLWS
jgi:hypothetical protein